MQTLRLDEEALAAQASQGEAMHALARELYPINRSITGPGLRATTRQLAEVIQLATIEVPSGTRVFDWTIPDEWILEDAFVEDEAGKRVVDFRQFNLHVVGYSEPVDMWLPLERLKEHLHTLPEQPDWIPYRTSYYSSSWGFCLAHRTLQALADGRYHVVIRSKLTPGSLTIAEHLHRGATEDEVLIFAHDCHPSLANDNLSGVVVAVHLAAWLKDRPTRYSYRFVFAPATIGSIAWLATNESRLERIRHGMVLSLLGGPGPLHYKESRSGKCMIDRAAWHVLRSGFADSRRLDFLPWGYDERQFCSPGIDLPVGRLTRTPNGEFPEYHTSADNLAFISPPRLGEAWMACLRIFEVLENDDRYINLAPKGEPQLGRRGLYRTTGGHQHIPGRQLALLWVLNQSDGTASLLDIADRSGLPFNQIALAAQDLESAGLLSCQSTHQIAA